MKKHIYCISNTLNQWTEYNSKSGQLCGYLYQYNINTANFK